MDLLQRIKKAIEEEHLQPVQKRDSNLHHLRGYGILEKSDSRCS